MIDHDFATKITSAGTPFASSDVGKTLKITGGANFTTGYRIVLSVASGVATLDQAAGSVDATGGSGTMLAGVPWAAAIVRNGPGDAHELYAAHLSSGTVYQLETGLTDDGTPIKIRGSSSRIPFEGDWLCRGEKAWLKVTPSGADTLALQVRFTGSEYRNLTDYPGSDGDPAQSWVETLSDTDTSEAELYQRLNFYRLKGRLVSVLVQGNVSNRPAIRDVRLNFSRVRRTRLSA